ncbi:hypothetical protein [Streptomyces sp. 049-1]|uniref:hypothetical protein n=1 Tax=Streptomyces sp. 049-1 TaxID=2789264 RepID=UPI00397F420F
MTEPGSHVEQQVQARIAAARVKIQAAREQRAQFAAARRRGLALRHARKLRNLAEAEQRQQAPEPPQTSGRRTEQPANPDKGERQ